MKLLPLLVCFAICSSCWAQPTASDITVTLNPGGQIKVVHTTKNSPSLDFCLLMENSGSFRDDLEVFKRENAAVARDIFNAVKAVRPDTYFAVAGFRDYPMGGYGAPGDYVYKLFSSMSPDESDWTDAINLMHANGGGDFKEAQYDAIVAATGASGKPFNDPNLGAQSDCGWSVPPVQRVLAVVTDAPFHVPDRRHVNDHASTASALNSQNITLLGLKCPRCGNELDHLAAATGGNVQSLATDSSDIKDQICQGIEKILCDVTSDVQSCDGGLSVTLTPSKYVGCQGGDVVKFDEIIAVDSNATLCGSHLGATVKFSSDGTLIHEQKITALVPLPAGTVDIDVGAKCIPKAIYCNSTDVTLAVAVLSNPASPAFIPTSIDPSTVTFGKLGTEAKVKQCSSGPGFFLVEDVDLNNDTVSDRVFHFEINKTGFTCGDIPGSSDSAILTGILNGKATGGVTLSVSGKQQFELTRISSSACPSSEDIVTISTIFAEHSPVPPFAAKLTDWC